MADYQPAAALSSPLRYTVVDVAAHAPAPGVAPRHLASVLRCIRSWRALTAIDSLRLTVHTNDVGAIASVLSALPAAPRGWSERVASWSKRSKREGSFILAHAHLHSWAAIVANQTSLATAFVSLEDDVCPSAEAIAAWAADESLLVASGAAAHGFQRGFYRFEVTRTALPEQSRPGAKYSDAFVRARAAAWRAAHNVSLGERFVLDERLRRKFQPRPPATCDTAPCLPQLAHDHPSQSARASSVTWCAHYPTVVVHGRPTADEYGSDRATHGDYAARAGGGPSSSTAQAGVRAFVSLANPYSAITAASRALVESFLLHSSGWNTTSARGKPSLRTRHKAYAVREFGSCTLHYAHEFVRFATIQPADAWPQGVFGGTRKIDGGMRRVLVPLVWVAGAGGAADAVASAPLGEHRGGHMSLEGDNSAPGPPSATGRGAGGGWRLDSRAGVHHRSDRVVNGPRKGNEQYGARFREHELVRCMPPARGP